VSVMRQGYQPRRPRPGRPPRRRRGAV